MSKFHFHLNGFKNVCHVYKDSLETFPFDTLSLTEVDQGDYFFFFCYKYFCFF
jgi:hypothetical protein